MENKEEKKVTPKRLLIDITDEMHHEIKMRALIRNIPMRTWVTRVLIQAISDEKKYE